MSKYCNANDCSNPRFSHGFCIYHKHLRTDDKWLNPLKKKKAIPNVSQKRLKQLNEYRKLRNNHLKSHPICECYDCNKTTTNLHHKKGRNNNLLCDVKYFMACCSTCHPERIHFKEPLWAYKHGYLITK